MNKAQDPNHRRLFFLAIAVLGALMALWAWLTWKHPLLTATTRFDSATCAHICQLEAEGWKEGKSYHWADSAEIAEGCPCFVKPQFQGYGLRGPANDPYAVDGDTGVETTEQVLLRHAKEMFPPTTSRYFLLSYRVDTKDGTRSELGWRSFNTNHGFFSMAEMETIILKSLDMKRACYQNVVPTFIYEFSCKEDWEAFQAGSETIFPKSKHKDCPSCIRIFADSLQVTHPFRPGIDVLQSGDTMWLRPTGTTTLDSTTSYGGDIDRRIDSALFSTDSFGVHFPFHCFLSGIWLEGKNAKEMRAARKRAFDSCLCHWDSVNANAFRTDSYFPSRKDTTKRREQP